MAMHEHLETETESASSSAVINLPDAYYWQAVYARTTMTDQSC